MKTKSRVYASRQPRQGAVKRQMDHLKQVLRSAVKVTKMKPRRRSK